VLLTGETNWSCSTAESADDIVAAWERIGQVAKLTVPLLNLSYSENVCKFNKTDRILQFLKLLFITLLNFIFGANVPKALQK